MPDDSKSQVPPPYPLAMVVCDTIWHEPLTGKRFLLGCFGRLQAKSFPAAYSTIGLHVALTNGRGKVPYKVQLVDVDEELEPIWLAEGELQLDNPRSVVELDFVMSEIVFPSPGDYRFQLFACGEFLMERRLGVDEIDEVNYE